MTQAPSPPAVQHGLPCPILATLALRPQLSISSLGVTFGPLNGPHSTLHTLVVAAAGSEMLSVDWLVSYAIVRYCARSLRLLPSQLPSPLLRLPLVCPYASLVVERVTEFVSPGFGLPIGSVACGWAGVTAQSSSAQRMHRERSLLSWWPKPLLGLLCFHHPFLWFRFLLPLSGPPPPTICDSLLPQLPLHPHLQWHRIQHVCNVLGSMYSKGLGIIWASTDGVVQ